MSYIGRISQIDLFIFVFNLINIFLNGKNVDNISNFQSYYIVHGIIDLLKLFTYICKLNTEHNKNNM